MRSLQWLTGATTAQKRALLTTSLCGMLDSMDVMLFSLVLVDLQRDLHMSAATSRFLGAAAPYLIGYIAEISGIQLALSSISLAFLAAVLIATGLHETKSHALD
ncbi:MAG: hypothetical protein ACYCSP_02215 [Acidobacteriaceae bacterium]